MQLSDYQKKRDFAATPEPQGDVPPTAPQTVLFPRFVVQEHHATHLHWDLRLEKDGVLKSWAVPKGIPLRQGLKRLAIQVEDHPLGYLHFTGTIPTGNYGAGQVFIWDQGYYAAAAFSEHKIVLAMLGSRMRGGYELVHTEGNHWLLCKIPDET